ncbi:ATP-binding protein [Hydrogenophaga sp. BPS33]|uniref:ATP-binding protein n=1 Tax=Hydrogenophaga sp. BPS33 TaxID=2651974 RepID=UPI00131FD83E|nr:ATP-binding protein [Hydrogenophaga sp. BPS33]QHE85615.1 ATP-binding protein [Hydrogenophaga sp. BPS33]
MPTPFVQPNSVFTRSLSNRLDEIGALADALTQWASGAQVPCATVRAVHLMLDELITNVVEHGYAPTQHGEIHVNAWLSPGQIEVQVRDHAVAYNPLTAPTPDLLADIDHRAIGGLGIHFVRQLADEASYARVRENGRDTNLVHIVKRYPPPGDHTRR